MLGNKYITGSDLFSNEIDVELINHAMVDSHMEKYAIITNTVFTAFK